MSGKRQFNSPIQSLISGFIKWSSLLMLLSIATYGLGQTTLPIVFQDDFSVRVDRWLFHASGAGTAMIQSGVLDLESTDPTEVELATYQHVLQTEKAFVMQTDMTLLDGSPETGYGMVWGANAWGTSYFAFLINPAGYFRVIESVSGEISELVPWTKHKKSGGMGEIRSLKIEKRGWKIQLFIGEKMVEEISYKRYHGVRHGILLEGIGKLEVERCSLRHPESPINLGPGPEQNAVVFPLDTPFNSPEFDEFGLFYADDKKHAWFTRSTIAGQPFTGKVYSTTFQGDTAWSQPLPSDYLMNDYSHNMLVDYDADRSRWMIAQSRADESGYEAEAIAMRTKHWLTGDWDPPKVERVKLESAQPMPNSWSTPAMGKEFVVVSAEQSKGSGDMDLYVMFRDESGALSEPRNLGPDINTYGIEMTPWLNEAGDELYFSSNGHPGYGGVDVFRSKRLSNTWTKWSVPENMGPQINGRAWDAWYRPITTDGRKAYLSSQDSIGADFDLYTVRIPADIRESPYVKVFGKILHADTGEPLSGTLGCVRISSERIQKQVSVNRPSLGYMMMIPYGYAYELLPQSFGLLSVVDTLDVRTITEFREIQRDVYVRPLAIGEAIPLDRVYFHRASPTLRPESFPELDELTVLLHNLPTLAIEIRGHTDNVGEPAALQALSQSRAEMVRDYLVEHGISSNRLSVRGLGSTEPIASNDDEETRKQNRRVEFVIIRM
ncbi:OmpA family protein [Pontibacter sp. G13]|uniref:OmpA family protein n=1 Tax=Pontibacter sp. G13 TaxID=3074898 RepID=UPI00288AE66C|nr:OmpA family protein [Pontibacter sp. G13]WNJ16879.1 OmpA family protein [Pontibacter sp. G13]